MMTIPEHVVVIRSIVQAMRVGKISSAEAAPLLKDECDAIDRTVEMLVGELQLVRRDVNAIKAAVGETQGLVKQLIQRRPAGRI